MKKPIWKKLDLEDPVNDLCSNQDGIYYDVVFCSFNNTWTCYYDDLVVKENLPSRQAGIDWFDKEFE